MPHSYSSPSVTLYPFATTLEVAQHLNRIMRNARDVARQAGKLPAEPPETIAQPDSIELAALKGGLLEMLAVLNR